MDQREQNRRREHGQDGHELSDLKVTHINRPGQTLHSCTCKWLGWLTPVKENA